MSTGMTYDSLLTDIRRYVERGFTLNTDPVVFAQLPRIVTLGERRCGRELKILGQEVPMTTTWVAGTGVYAKPTLWRSTVSMNFGRTVNGAINRTFVLPRSYEYCRNYWPNDDERDVPEFYADYDAEHWLIVPTPIATYPVEVICWQQPPLLDDATQTNWLTDYAPDLILASALLEICVFLGDPNKIAQSQAYYDRVLAATNGEDLQKMIDRATRRTTT